MISGARRSNLDKKPEGTRSVLVAARNGMVTSPKMTRRFSDEDDDDDNEEESHRSCLLCLFAQRRRVEGLRRSIAGRLAATQPDQTIQSSIKQYTTEYTL